MEQHKILAKQNDRSYCACYEYHIAVAQYSAFGGSFSWKPLKTLLNRLIRIYSYGKIEVSSTMMLVF